MEWTFEEGHIYHADGQGNVTAELTYVRSEDAVEINHTFVDSSLRGQGVAGRMMTAAMEYFESKGWKVTASCSYAKAWLEKNR